MQQGDLFFKRELLEDEVGAFVPGERLGFIQGRVGIGGPLGRFWAAATVDRGDDSSGGYEQEE